MIKKLSILLLLALMPAVMMAQSKKVDFVKKTVDLKGDEVVLPHVLNDKNYSVIDNLTTVSGNVIGFTYYDYMTNGALGQKILRFDDNTLMVGQMAGVDQTASVATRGTYYNYYNGTTWLDTAVIWHRVETARRGWGNIGAFDDKTAVIISHVATEMAINSGSPEAPAWTESIVPNSAIISWPKSSVTNAGANFNIYFTGGSSSILPTPFYRSTDGGTSWDNWVALADTNSDLYPDYTGANADDYMIDSKGDWVSVVSSTTQGNVTLYTSTDQGSTWTSKTVYDAAAIDNGLDQIPFDSSFFPASNYKLLGIGYPDGTCDVLVDPNGVTHVAWGNYELGYYINTDTLSNPIRDAQGKLQRSFFITDYSPTAGVMYWNTGMTGGPVKAAVATADMMGSSLYYDVYGTSGFYPTSWNSGRDMSLMGMPNMAYDADGHVYMVFQGFKDGDLALLDQADPSSNSPFGHVYVIGSADMGATWTTPVDIYAGTTGEDVNFPAIVNNAGAQLDVLIQDDSSPGTWLQQTQHPQNKNYFIHVVVPKPLVGVNDGNTVTDFNLEQNYPNPFNPATVINYAIPSRTNVSLKVYDMLGRLVKTLVNTTQETGSYSVNFNASGLASGLYVYTLEAGSYKVSKKMMLMK